MIQIFAQIFRIKTREMEKLKLLLLVGEHPNEYLPSFSRTLKKKASVSKQIICLHLWGKHSMLRETVCLQHTSLFHCIYTIVFLCSDWLYWLSRLISHGWCIIICEKKVMLIQKHHSPNLSKSRRKLFYYIINKLFNRQNQIRGIRNIQQWWHIGGA